MDQWHEHAVDTFAQAGISAAENLVAQLHNLEFVVFIPAWFVYKPQQHLCRPTDPGIVEIRPIVSQVGNHTS